MPRPKWQDHLDSVSAREQEVRDVVSSYQEAVDRIRRDRDLTDEGKSVRLKTARDQALAKIKEVREATDFARGQVEEFVTTTEKDLPGVEVDGPSAAIVQQQLDAGKAPLEIAKMAVANKDLATFRAVQRAVGYIEGMTPATIREIEKTGEPILPEQERELASAQRSTSETVGKFDALVKMAEAQVTGDDHGAFAAAIEGHYAGESQ